MSVILNIDTSGQEGFASLGADGKELAVRYNLRQNDHAAFLHPAVSALLAAQKLKISELAAIAVVAGPGSYTGVRIAMAAAKGFAYAAGIPLITVSATEVMAMQVVTEETLSENSLLCPLIDARREEVFTAIYDAKGAEISSPQALVLDKNFMREELGRGEVFFFGSGRTKVASEVSS